MAKVFISHKREDTSSAQNIANRLQQLGLGSYLDVADNMEVKDGPALSDYIRQRMRECTQLLAVISPETQNSWWVPWEIGVANEKDYPIASFVIQSVPSVPSYLQKWPFLRTDQHLEIYARESLSFELGRRSVRAFEGVGRVGATAPRTVSDFHRVLKQRLGQ